MAGSETTNDKGSFWLDLSPIYFSPRPAPRRFTAADFAQRMCQNFIVYSSFLGVAIYACLLVFAPVEIFVLSVVGIALAVIAILLLSPSRRKLHRLLAGGLAAGYIAGAAALLKAFEAFLHRM